jgi:hypothetical protein
VSLSSIRNRRKILESAQRRIEGLIPPVRKEGLLPMASRRGSRVIIVWFSRIIGKNSGDTLGGLRGRLIH